MDRQPGPGAAGEVARLRAAARGDAQSFAELASARLPATFRLACAILGNPADAASATQDAFVAAWHELPRLRDTAGFDIWFDGILVGLCRMQARRQAARGDPPADAALARLVAASTALALDAAAVLDLLDDRYEQLDADDRVILALRIVDDRPVSDIARLLHLPPGTVKWRLHEARSALADVLEAV